MARDRKTDASEQIGEASTETRVSSLSRRRMRRGDGNDVDIERERSEAPPFIPRLATYGQKTKEVYITSGLTREREQTCIFRLQSTSRLSKLYETTPPLKSGKAVGESSKQIFDPSAAIISENVLLKG